jgi:hypothetical protein
MESHNTVHIHEKKINIINNVIKRQNEQLLKIISIKENICIKKLEKLLVEFNSH